MGLESQYALKAKAEREQLLSQLRQEKDNALAKARQEGEAKEAAARADERRTATAEMETKLSAVTTAMQAANDQAENLKTQLDASAAGTTEKVNQARSDAIKQAEAALQPQVVAAQSATHQAVEQARALSEKVQTARLQIVQLTQDVAAAREEGRKTADAELRLQLTALGEEKQVAIAAKTAAEQQVQALRDGQEKAVSERVQEAREALEKNHRDGIDAEQAKHFEEKQKIQNKVEELQRQLDNKTALELGEGAEVNHFDARKVEFPGDDIMRIAKGVAGADIRHMVRHNGEECGLILCSGRTWRPCVSGVASGARRLPGAPPGRPAAAAAADAARHSAAKRASGSISSGRACARRDSAVSMSTSEARRARR